MERFTESTAALYIHVPFCAQKCHYCAFYSREPSPGDMARFVDSLIGELASIAPGFRPTTIFCGGGTPSLLPLRDLRRLLTALDELGLVQGQEFTVECNPATVSPVKARTLRDAGVNRVSMGVQSLDDDLLVRLGRPHSRDAVVRSYAILREQGFDNINLDFIFGIPGQTLGQWERTLDQALALEPDHLSCYELIYEEDTPFFQQLEAGQVDVDEDLNATLYQTLLQRAANSGLVQYEIANFARQHDDPPHPVPATACQHNINYWQGGDYIGVGPSACSRWNRWRARNIANTEIWQDRIGGHQNSREMEEELTPLQHAGELAAFALRMPVGIHLPTFFRRTGFDLRTEWQPEIQELLAQGRATLTDDRFALTVDGLLYADAAGALFVRPETPKKQPINA